MVRDAVWSLGALFSALTLAEAAVVDLYWNISYTTANPDGLFDRTVIGVNGTWPPPPITVHAGDVIRMHAFNGLGDAPTTLHFHGMFFNGSNYYDGAMGVTQCGIPPGQQFVYNVDTTHQVGTYWVHAHSRGQYVDGLRAPVVILPPEHSPLSYDDEFTIILSDWYHSRHSALLSTFLSRANPMGAEPVPNSALVYFAQNNTYRPEFNAQAEIRFIPGRIYRLRILNMGAIGMFYFKIDGHQMDVIEVDGTDVEPYPVDLLSVTVAQRYSVLVRARNETTQNFLLHANFDSDMFDDIPPNLQLNYTSSIIYDPTSEHPVAGEPIAAYKTQSDLEFRPLIAQPMLTKTKTIQLNVFFTTFQNGINRAAFNNVTFVPPRVPTSMSIDSAPQDSLKNPVIYGPQTNAFVIEHFEIVELQVINWDSGNHPFHLHGQQFQVVDVRANISSSEPTYSNQTLSNPMRRDTIQVPGGGSVSLRFVADNPGAWLFHCHVEWHLEAGLAAVLIVAPELVQKSHSVPAFMKEQCKMMGMPFSGNAGGLSGDSIYDLSRAPHGPYPQRPGFHAQGIASITACIISSLLGVLTIIWYTKGYQIEEEELEEELRQRIKDKKKGKALLAQATRSVFHSLRPAARGRTK